jgi:protein phosphatase
MYVVADGVGGYQGGAEAAQATVDGFTRGLEGYSSRPLAEALTATAQAINQELDERARSQDPPVKMSSTVVLALIKGSTATIAHIGDSRAYLVRNGSMRPITRDHSVVQRLIDQGMVDASHAGEHPSASVLTQALGQSTDVHLDIVDIDLLPGDALLLCSDGLWGYASAEEMEAAVTSKELSPTACAEALLDMALRAGGGDNISIQFLKFSAPAVMAPPPGRFLGLPPKAVLGAGLALVLAAASYGTYRVVKQWPHSGTEKKAAEASAGGGSGVSTVTPPPPPKTAAVKPEKVKSKVRVYVIDDAGADDWRIKLRNLDYVDVITIPTKEGGSCRAREGEQPILFYKPVEAENARKIKKDLGLESVTAMKPGNNDCGKGDIFAMPAKKTGFREAMKEKVGHAAEKAADKVKGEFPPLPKLDH